MDYTGKLLKGFYEVINLLKDIKNQNKAILRELKEFPHLEKYDSGDCSTDCMNNGEYNDYDS